MEYEDTICQYVLRHSLKIKPIHEHKEYETQLTIESHLTDIMRNKEKKVPARIYWQPQIY